MVGAENPHALRPAQPINMAKDIKSMRCIAIITIASLTEFIDGRARGLGNHCPCGEDQIMGRKVDANRYSLIGAESTLCTVLQNIA
jgi:hypothetical protein